MKYATPMRETATTYTIQRIYQAPFLITMARFIISKTVSRRSKGHQYSSLRKLMKRHLTHLIFQLVHQIRRRNDRPYNCRSNTKHPEQQPNNSNPKILGLFVLVASNATVYSQCTRTMWNEGGEARLTTTAYNVKSIDKTAVLHDSFSFWHQGKGSTAKQPK